MHYLSRYLEETVLHSTDHPALLNVMGYYMIFLGLEYRNDISMIQKLNEGDYEVSQSIAIKIPIVLPYMNDNKSFERVDGQFKYNGEFYRLVKQKYARDTLTVICVKDHENKRIHEALSNYVKTFTDKPADHQTNIKISFIKDYIPQSFSLTHLATGWQRDIMTEGYSKNLIPSFYPSIIHPPERG